MASYKFNVLAKSTPYGGKKVNLTIGFGWLIIYGIIALIGILGGLIWAGAAFSERESPIGGIFTLVVGVIALYFAFYAGTHYRVGINERSLLVNTIDQTVVGVRESGVQSRPLFGAKSIDFPANSQYKYFCDLGPGTESATSAVPNSTPLFVDTTFYLDLRNMDIEKAYLAYNGGWDRFVEMYLAPSCADWNRVTTAQFKTQEHETKRDEWEHTFETYASGFLSDDGNGFNISLVPGRTIMAFDFVNELDAEAYDTANRAAYMITQRENELVALGIEAQMVEIRANMIVSSTVGTIDSMETFLNYIEKQPVETWPYLMRFMDSQAQYEYLRLVAQNDPNNFLPPFQTPVTTYGIEP